MKVVNTVTGKSVSLGGLQFDLLDDQIDFAPADLGSTVFLDLGGTQSASINGTTQTYRASSLDIDSAGASYLDSALGTAAFTAGTQFGGFSTTYSS